MQIKRYIFPYIDANMYLMVENSEALVIDPHIDMDADRYLRENGVVHVTILLTHEHFDHTCGIPWFREHYDTKVICQKEALNPKSQKISGRPITISLVLSDQGRDSEIKELEETYPAYTFTAESVFDDRLTMVWQGHRIEMEHLPGHSPASCLIFMDEDKVFTGDSLIPGCEPTLRWPGSDRKLYMESAVQRLLELSEGVIVYPGHRECVAVSQLKYVNETGKWMKKPIEKDEICKLMIGNIYVDEKYRSYRKQFETYLSTAKCWLERGYRNTRNDFSISWNSLAVVFSYDYCEIVSALSSMKGNSKSNGRFIPISQQKNYDTNTSCYNKNFVVINCRYIFSQLQIADDSLGNEIDNFIKMARLTGCIIHELNHYQDYVYFYNNLITKEDFSIWLYSEFRSKYYQEGYVIRYGFPYPTNSDDFKDAMCSHVQTEFNKFDKNLCDAEKKEYTVMHQIGQLACWLDEANYIGLDRKDTDFSELLEELKSKQINLQRSQYCPIKFWKNDANVTGGCIEMYDRKIIDCDGYKTN